MTDTTFTLKAFYRILAGNLLGHFFVDYVVENGRGWEEESFSWLLVYFRRLMVFNQLKSHQTFSTIRFFFIRTFL